MLSSLKKDEKSFEEEKAETERFADMFNTSNFMDWDGDETLFFMRYLVEHPHIFSSYTIKVEKDILARTSDKLLVEKVYNVINEWSESFDPSELVSNWQLIEYFTALICYVQKILNETILVKPEVADATTENSVA